MAESSPALYETRMAGAGSDGEKRKENSLFLALFFPITTCAPLGRGLVSNELGTSLARVGPPLTLTAGVDFPVNPN